MPLVNWLAADRKRTQQKASLLEQQNSDSAANGQIKSAMGILNTGSGAFAEWSESDIRQLVDTVKVLSTDRVKIRLRGEIEIE